MLCRASNMERVLFTVSGHAASVCSDLQGEAANVGGRSVRAKAGHGLTQANLSYRFFPQCPLFSRNLSDAAQGLGSRLIARHRHIA